MVGESDAFTRLQEWMSAPFFTKLNITSLSKTNRTLTTKEDTPPNTTLLFIPNHKTITTTKAMHDSRIHTILSSHPPPPPTTNETAALLLYVMLLSKDHDLKPWFDTLPKTIVTATTAQSIQSLKGTPLYQLATQLRHELNQLYEEWYQPITNSCPEFEHLTGLDRFLYIHGIIESRAFQLNETTTLTPYLDLCNHSPQPNARVQQASDGVKLLSTASIKAGEEVCIKYGDLSNLHLLLHWGFAVHSNPRDELMISLQTPSDVPRMIILACHVPDLEFSVSKRDPLPAALLRALRILSLDRALLENGVRRDYDVKIGDDNERRVVGLLKDIIENFDNFESGFGDAEDDGFERFCEIYKIGIVDILKTMKSKIVDDLVS